MKEHVYVCVCKKVLSASLTVWERGTRLAPEAGRFHPPHYTLRGKAESEGVEDDAEVRFKGGLLVFLALAPLNEL